MLERIESSSWFYSNDFNRYVWWIKNEYQPGFTSEIYNLLIDRNVWRDPS